ASGVISPDPLTPVYPPAPGPLSRASIGPPAAPFDASPSIPSGLAEEPEASTGAGTPRSLSGLHPLAAQSTSPHKAHAQSTRDRIGFILHTPSMINFSRI